MSNTEALKFTATKNGWRTIAVVQRETPDPKSGAMTQEALVILVRNYNFQFAVTGDMAWTATSKWEGKSRRGYGATREAAVANLH